MRKPLLLPLLVFVGGAFAGPLLYWVIVLSTCPTYLGAVC